MRVLRLSLAAYRMPRRVVSDGAASRRITATRGITAGSSLATTELKILSYGVLATCALRYREVTIPTLYVDDLTLRAYGSRYQVATKPPLAIDTSVKLLEELGLVVSVQKTLNMP